MKGKQKAFLRGLANTIDPIFQVGKGGITENLLDQINEALEARELIKVNVLKSSPGERKGVAAEIAEKTGAELVQTIGNKVTLYRKSKEKPRIILPE